MAIGRPRNPGTDAERAEARRAKVRANVQAFRRRQKEQNLVREATRHVTEHYRNTNQVDATQEFSTESPRLMPLVMEFSPTNFDSPSLIKDPGTWMWAIPSELGAKIIGTTYHDAFTSVLRNRLSPHKTSAGQIHCESPKRFSVHCTTWITSVTLDVSKPETEVLMEALLATALAIIGRDRSDPDMSLHSAYVQSRALRRLRCSLTNYQGGDTNIDPMLLSLAALTCAMSELIANLSWANFNHHMLGVGALIFHRGIRNLDNVVSRKHFYGYRGVQSPFLFMARQSTFLSNPEWINFPWKEDLELAQHPMHTMLDIALRILPELAKQNTRRKWKRGCLKERLRRCQVIEAELDRWEQTLRARHGGRLYKRRAATWGGVFSQCLNFAHVSSAVAFAMYTAVRVHVSWLIANVSGDIASDEPTFDVVHPSPAVLEALRWSKLACESLEYFHTAVSRLNFRVATIWPLEAAWESFDRVQSGGTHNVVREVQWCRATAERFAANQIPPFRWR